MAARLRLLVPAVLAATAFSVPAANAGLDFGGLLGGNCPSGGTQVFAPWQDFANYYLAPNGSFEFGTTGWSLSGGAKVVDGNEPFLPTGTHSLSLPSGSSALSPAVCLGPKQLYVRMFAADAGGTDSRPARARRLVRPPEQGARDHRLSRSSSPAAAGRRPSKLNSSGGLQVPLLPILGSTSARVQITPLGGGSNWQIDDLYIDPCVVRIG